MEPHQRLCINGKIYIKITFKSSMLSLCNSTIKSDSVFSTHATTCFCFSARGAMHHSHPTVYIIEKTKDIQVIGSSSFFFFFFFTPSTSKSERELLSLFTCNTSIWLPPLAFLPSGEVGGWGRVFLLSSSRVSSWAEISAWIFYNKEIRKGRRSFLLKVPYSHTIHRNMLITV